MASTSIEWTDVTWNPVAGCSIVSPGCTNCYAMRMAARLQAMEMPKYKGLTRKSGRRHVWTGKVRTDEKALTAPLRWKKPVRVFVNSMSDLFHDGVADAFIEKVWLVMRSTPQHTYQILTKRPDRLATMSKHLETLPNVWLGTSVESEAFAFRLDELRRARAAVKFVSFEPLIGSVASADLQGIDWAIVGGESGPHSRPIDPIWVSEIESKCREAGTAFFFKQWGGKRKDRTGRLYKNRTYDEMPSVAV